MVPDYSHRFGLTARHSVQKNVFREKKVSLFDNTRNSSCTFDNKVHQYIPFLQSEVDPSLFIHRKENGEFLFLIVYIRIRHFSQEIYANRKKMQDVFEKEQHL